MVAVVVLEKAVCVIFEYYRYHATVKGSVVSLFDVAPRSGRYGAHGKVATGYGPTTLPLRRSPRY